MRSLRQRHQKERGFALLLVFAMAAAVALLLYKELPRAVFESQRVKEDMLVERGEEYKTALRRYYMKFRKRPNTLDELENTNGVRYLRRRYKDPFTGKDEWKIIKADAMGNLIDSVSSKKSVTDKDKQGGGTGSVSLGHSLGDAGNQPGEAEGQDVTKKRASDRGIGADLALQQYQQRDNAGPPDPNNPPPATIVPQPGFPQAGQGQSVPQYGPQAGMGQTSGQQIPGQQIPGQPGFSPGTTPIPGQQFPPGTLPPGLQLPGMVPQQPGYPQQYQQQQYQQQQYQQQQQQGGSAMTQQGLGGSGSPMTQTGLGGSQFQTGPGGRPGFNPLQGVMQPGVANSQAPNQSAIQAINQQLTNPTAFRGGGFGTPASPTGAPPNGLINGMPQGAIPGAMGAMGAAGTGGPGIAGFASKYKAEGIKLIDERSKINEWEFIYDPRKDKRVTGQTGSALPGSGLPGTGLPGSTPNSPPTGSGSRRQ